MANASGSDFSPGNPDSLAVQGSNYKEERPTSANSHPETAVPFGSSLARRRKSDSEVFSPAARSRAPSLFSRIQDKLHISSNSREVRSSSEKADANTESTSDRESHHDEGVSSQEAGTSVKTRRSSSETSSGVCTVPAVNITSTVQTGSKGEVAPDDSTDSENDPEPSQTFQRKLSTNKDIKNTASLKEGYLLKQTSSFQRWHRRYFKIKGRTLYYGKNEKAQIFDEISLTELTIAESSSKTFKHGFQVITPFRILMLAAETRTVMDDWVHAIRVASDANFFEAGDHSNLLSGSHVWYATSHARPTYCNICREQLCGVTSQGLSCEICKFKTHKRCASKALNNCKWTTLASMGKEIIEELDGTLSLPHQWLEGNLPVSAKCDVCERTCGSVLRLQDWRCLWCRASVHTACRPIICQKCPVGRISVVPPTALHTIGSDDAWETSRSLSGCSPLLVFVNSKSGDHQGLKFLRRFKQLLNPAQVFDLVNGGPRRGLEFFRHFEPFRILVCGGDGSVGWVMSEIDKLSMHRQCQVGVVPLGTGNDLARVLGWGASCDDDAHLPHLLEKYEKATTKMLDRWSVMTFERGVVLKPSMSRGLCLTNSKPQISQYEDSVVSHLQNILQSDQHQSVITSAKVLCETVRDMIGKIGASAPDSEIDEKCATLSQKLDSLLQTLHEETENTNYVLDEDERELQLQSQDWKDVVNAQAQIPLPAAMKKLSKFRQRDTLMSRANSLKKAVRQIIEHAERTIDEQNSAPPVVIVRPMSLTVSPASDQVIKTDYFQKTSSPIDPNLTLPVPSEFADQMLLSIRRESVGDESKVQRDHNQSEKCGEELEEQQIPLAGGISFPKIEVESPSSSSATKSPSEIVDFGDVDLSSMNTEENLERASLSPPNLSQAFLTVPGTSPPGSPNSLNSSSSSSNPSTSPPNPNNFPRGSSPRASRRVSMGSLFKPLEVEIPKSPNTKRSSFELLENHFFSSPSSHSNSPSPNKMSQSNGKKTLPIINPLVSHPSWPTIASGGVVSKALLANADAMCCVATPLMDPEDEEDLMIGFDEKCVLNNYFGIGIDAKITLDFHMKREEHPEKCRSRTKNFMWYGVLGSKEYLQQTCKNLEQRVQLECDGKILPLPSLQGIVILNIQSFMGGTNFWGGTKEDDCFLAPSFDDRILEVVAVFDSMQMAASRLINLQHHRIAQCHSIKITLLGDEPIPVQVDGEAWLQPPGVIKIIHKNRMQMLCRNRALESSLKSWEEKQKQHLGGISPTSTETEELDKKRHSKRLFSLGKLRDHHKKDVKRTGDVTPDGGSDAFSEEAFSSEAKEVEKWTLSDVGDWLDHLDLGEYKYHFSRHDIQGAELLCLQRRDIKDLGITKVGHIKRILQGIENLLAEHKA